VGQFANCVIGLLQRFPVDRGRPAVMGGGLAKPILRCAREITATLPGSCFDTQEAAATDAKLGGEYIGDTCS